MNSEGRLLCFLMRDWAQGKHMEVARDIKYLSPAELVTLTMLLVEEYRTDAVPHLRQLRKLLISLDAR